jgi:lipoprotein-anchoring transpeptidase ErfK/SrfK
MPFSRREFLKLSGLALSAAILPPPPPDEAPRPITHLGRVPRSLGIYDRPSSQATQVGVLPTDSVFNIYATTPSEDERYKRPWYQMRRGYVYSGFVQPVRWQLQTPALDVPTEGFLGEITVPLTSARAWYTPLAAEDYRFYYSTTHWVIDAQTGDDGAIWYKLAGERSVPNYWVLGEHVRRVGPDELTPLSPNVADKRIEVDLAQQTFRCFENGALVLDTLCSTGIYLRTENGRRIYGTPAGDWAIIRKRASRHMAGEDGASADFFDLPGVPWVSYFHWWGTAMHGTYWHNDFGTPHSHGCINLPCETAKWVYRWTLPQADLKKDETLGEGTPLIVF